MDNIVEENKKLFIISIYYEYEIIIFNIIIHVFNLLFLQLSWLYIYEIIEHESADMIESYSRQIILPWMQIKYKRYIFTH